MSKNNSKLEDKKDKKKHICPDCATILSSPYNLKIHLETKCSTQKNHICNICQSRFLTIHSLKTHIQSIHQHNKKFICTHCGKSFASKGQLIVHERCHSKERPFVCEVCSKAFSHRETLVTHSTIHTKIKPYMCENENCKQTFSCVGNLIKHRKVRPTTCGLPIYTNKKICKRAGVKCAKRKVPVIIVDTPPINESEIIASENDIVTMIIQEEHQDETYNDEQYVIVTENQNQSDFYESTKEFTKKEMEVLGFMSFDSRNLHEAEYAEINDQNNANEQEDETEMIIEELEEVAADGDFIEETYEELEELSQTENETKTEDDEFLQYIALENFEFLCKLCPKIYTKKNISINHLRKEHQIILSSFNYDSANRYRKPQKNQTWKCRFCPKKYTSSKIVERHEKVHGEDGLLIHKCTCCRQYFRTLEEVDSHLYEAHSDRLICDVCSKKFDHPEKLLNHKKYSHSEKKHSTKKYLFVCTVCGRDFNTKVALSDHERSNCGRNPIYKCPHCDKSYQSAGNLKIHLSIHSQELNFQCSYCPKKFRTKGQLTVHNRTHLNIKPFKCKFQDCNAEFAHRESLLTHHTTHTGIKRFECEKCLARFSCISNLLAHRRSRRKDCSDARICKVKNAETSLKAV